MGRRDEHECEYRRVREEVGCEAQESEANDARRLFLKSGLAAGVVATGLTACKKKPGQGQSRQKQAPGGGADAPARPAPPVAEKRPTPSRPTAGKPAPGQSSGATKAAGSNPRPTPGKSRVVQVVNAKAYDAKGVPEGKAVKIMVDTAVMELTGKKSAKEAWSSLFKPTDKVGLKPNCLGRQLCWPHPATVDAVIEGLLSAGVAYDRMYMWDMWGFNASPLSRRYRNSKMKVRHIKAWGYSRKKFKIPSGPAVQLTKPLLLVDAVVNIPVLKDHDLTGVTCAMKNMALGSVPKPSIYHANRQGERLCDPMVPEIYNLSPIKDKTRLIVADAFNIIINGGPKGNAAGLRKLHSVFAATDPVAMDRVAWTIIDQHRVAAKLPKLNEKPLAKRRPSGRPRYVLTAEKMGLGTADPQRIDHIVKTL